MFWPLICIAFSQTVWATSRYHLRQVQGSDPDWRPDCTTYSFSYPLWRIYDPIWMLPERLSGGKYGDFWFTAHNMANNYQVECEIKNENLFPDIKGNEDSFWHSCKDNSTQFRFSLASNEFQLKQSWTCDNSPRLVFLKPIISRRKYLRKESLASSLWVRKGPHSLLS
jgi:hypothetical protein